MKARRNKRPGLRQALYATVGSAAAAVSGGATASQDIRLLISGSPSVTFEAACVVAPGTAQERSVVFEGTAPVERHFGASGLTCTVTQTSAGGSLTVEVTRPGTVSRSSVNGVGATTRIAIR